MNNEVITKCRNRNVGNVFINGIGDIGRRGNDFDNQFRFILDVLVLFCSWLTGNKHIRIIVFFCPMWQPSHHGCKPSSLLASDAAQNRPK
jgi:hypothetical protein